MNEFIAKKMEVKKNKKVILEEKFSKLMPEKKEIKPKETPTTIYVGNLNYKKDEVGIKKLFSSYGHVSSVKIILKDGTKLKSGVAFVEMSSKEKAERAISALNGKEIDERTLKVSIANDRFPSRKKFQTPKK